VGDRGPVYVTPDADIVAHTTILAKRDYRWVQRSIGVALTSAHPFKMGAVAIRGGNLQGYATNRIRNHPKVVDDWYDCSVHAEQSLAENCDVRSSIVYIARVTPGGNAALAKPCRSCLQSLTESGVKRIVWTEDDESVGMMSLG
jgi:tRNA(Arg) A34 adenosine deaminase TadA